MRRAVTSVLREGAVEETWEHHPLGRANLAGPVLYPAQEAFDLLRAFRGWAAEASDEIRARVSFTSAPALPAIAEQWHGAKVVVLVAAATGPTDEPLELVRRVQEVACPITDPLDPMPPQARRALLDPPWPPEARAYVQRTMLERFDDRVIDRLCKLHHAAPGPRCEIHVHQMDRSLGRADTDATTAQGRPQPLALSAVAGWYRPSTAAMHVEWTRAVVGRRGARRLNTSDR